MIRRLIAWATLTKKGLEKGFTYDGWVASSIANPRLHLCFYGKDGGMHLAFFESRKAGMDTLVSNKLETQYVMYRLSFPRAVWLALRKHKTVDGIGRPFSKDQVLGLPFYRVKL